MSDLPGYYCFVCMRRVDASAHRAPLTSRPGFEATMVACPGLAVDVGDDLLPNGGIAHTLPLDKLEELLRPYIDLKFPEGEVNEMPEVQRHRTEFHFRKCPHTQASIVHVGGWDVEICTRCGAEVGKHCRHEKMEWLVDGRILICVNCGIDGT